MWLVATFRKTAPFATQVLRALLSGLLELCDSLSTVQGWTQTMDIDHMIAATVPLWLLGMRLHKQSNSILACPGRKRPIVHNALGTFGSVFLNDPE